MGLSVEIQKKLGDFYLDISFASDARRIGILGPSGCGKSMTLKSIAGIEHPDRGRIVIGIPWAAGETGPANPSDASAPQTQAVANVSDDVATEAEGGAPVDRVPDDVAPGSQELADASAPQTQIASSAPVPTEGGIVLYDSARHIDWKPQKRNVGYMFQNYALFPTMTVARNIAAGLKLSPKKRRARVQEMVERFHLQGLENHLPGQLSGGQQQRVALARIMAYRPDLILLDEPFSALDEHLKERLQHELMAMLEDYQGQVIMVSHNRDELYRFAEELLILEGGHVIARGKTRQLFDDPGTAKVARATGCKNICPALRMDAHTLKLPEWGATLHLERDIPENTCAIGYRAHFFEPVWGARRENCIPFRPAGIDELPFERRYYIRPAGADERPFERRNCTQSARADERPFERRYYIRPAGSGETEAAELICWFVQHEMRNMLDQRPAPDYLQLKEEAIMLLHE